ncbi:MAG: hypothetical protein V2J12_09915 [Gammaproteobacteria bacterium]|jgi:hypothetical protein|nr:hypothetical protein [Gammaproteobacteria bacterium]
MQTIKRFYTALGALALSSAALLPAAPATAADEAAAATAVHADQHQAAAAEFRAQLEADLNALGLSATQKQDLGALVQLYGEQLAAIIRRGEAARVELLQLSPLDPDYDTVTNQVSQAAAANAADVVNTLSELQRTAFLLLSNAQQDRFLQLRAERQQEMRAKLAELRARREAERAASGLPAAGD